jgi:hypothetical protein
MQKQENIIFQNTHRYLDGVAPPEASSPADVRNDAAAADQLGRSLHSLRVSVTDRVQPALPLLHAAGGIHLAAARGTTHI